MPVVKCLRCEKKFYVTPHRYKRNMSLFNERFFCSIKCSSEYRKEHNEYYGERNPAWKGGITKQPFICKNCGKTFFRPNVSSKLRYLVKFCSVKCSGEWLSKIQPGRRKLPHRFDKLKDEVFVTTDERTLAYIAGFFDGEGSVFMTKDYPAVTFSNTCKDVIEWIRGNLGGGSLIETRYINHYRTSYTLRYQALLEVDKILSALRPYLIVKKKDVDKVLTVVQQKIDEIKLISQRLYGV